MADCGTGLPLPVVCFQCGPGVNNACHFKVIGKSLGRTWFTQIVI